ncbi:potassium channel subfamily K member 18-like isoform X1 [Acanthaster planci]|uniref:Potassium channel subfamily K member 18-like isoform X1 n=1 Tax=Acanthaster planci TaxID=133434 RepID=A0A8B7XIX7_ACAPL|nr:potassium channel subfamily K member 18-like isoform X1 [Acanthaster planci]
MSTSTLSTGHRSMKFTKTTATSLKVDMPTSREPRDYRRMDSRSYRYFRRIQPLLFCLAAVVALLGYAFIGAAIFVYLEEQNEMDSYKLLMDTRRDFLSLVNASIEAAANRTSVTSVLTVSTSNATLNATTATPDVLPALEGVNFTEIDEELQKYEKLVKKFRNLDPSGKPMWNYFGALFFSATVISTIGYGNIAPVTIGGRVFCMIYAVFGIAMLLLVLASIGSLFARGATLTYRLLHMNIAMAKGAPPPKKKKKLRAVRVPAPAEGGTEGVQMTDKQTNGSTEQPPSMDDVIKEIWSQEPGIDQGDMPPMHVMTLKGKSEDGAGPAQRDNAGTSNDDEEENDQVDIPLSIVLIFALMYVCMLAGLLCLWENQWNYFDAFYFSFITLTTIGFGDLVPEHQKNLLGCTFFILLGMAIMSMCIALAQEIITKKVAWISEKVGVALIKAKPT